MPKKRIATSVDALINVDRYEHLQVTKYAEREIEYTSEEDMIAQEDQLTDELLADITRSLNKVPEKWGKSGVPIKDFEEKVQKKLPAWLEGNAIPNIANNAEKQFKKNSAEAEAKAEEKSEKKAEDSEEVEKLIADESSETPAEQTVEDIGSDGDDDNWLTDDIF